MVFVEAIDATGPIYTNQTGRFPITSSQQHKYIMVSYDYDSNWIFTEPLKSCSELEMVCGYSKLHKYLTNRGLKPQLQQLDNEAPSGLKKFMKQNGVDYQLVPNHIHTNQPASPHLRR
jgi:hypothetical protein